MLLNVSCGFVLCSSPEGLDHVLNILCILKESTVITAGSQYVFVEKIFTAASNPEEIGSVQTQILLSGSKSCGEMSRRWEVFPQSLILYFMNK